MRVIARSSLAAYWVLHPETMRALSQWYRLVSAADWKSTSEVAHGIGSAKVLNRERVRFAVRGGSHRLIASFDFQHGIAYVKFVGTHAEYDRIDALTVAQF